MNAPIGSGLYWASRVINCEAYDMIVEVLGEPPFLEVREWRNGKTNYTAADLTTIREPLVWGPRVECPKRVRPMEIGPAGPSGVCGCDCYCSCHQEKLMCLRCWPVGARVPFGEWCRHLEGNDQFRIDGEWISRIGSDGAPAGGYPAGFVHPLSGPVGPE